MRVLNWFSWPSLPLFSKELIEQSNRRRTFVIRTAYALLFYTFMFWLLWEQIGWDTNSLAMLGRGQNLFNSLVGMQFFAIYAFLPGLACGVLTAEKERDTLAMLLLTKLGPWTILVEKLLSRLMPLMLLLLLSLPLLAVAYSLGGVQPHEIVSAAWVLGLTAVQVGALAVFCSAWFRTTAGAFVGTYVIGLAIVCFPFLLYMLLAFFVLLLGGDAVRPNDDLLELMANFLGPYVFYEGLYNRWRFGMPTTTVGSWPTIGSIVYMIFRTAPLWLSAAAFLVAARVVLWRRAFIQPKHRILQFFRWLDGLFHRLNQNRFTKGIVLVHESVALPHFQPIAWRETKKKTLGTTRYLVRFLLVIEPPVLIFLLIADVSMNGNNSSLPGTMPNVLLWLITAIALTVLSTGLMATEKSKQTLDVLLSTPLTTKEIIAQKLAGVRKLTFVLWIPLLTVVAFDAWWRMSFWGYGNSSNVPGGFTWFLIQRLTPLIVYPAVITWMGFHFGLRLRTQGQAMLATIGVIVAWCIVPAMMNGPIGEFRRLGKALFGEAGWAIFSPAIYVVEPLRDELWRQSYYRSPFSSYRETPTNEFHMQVAAFVLHFGLCIAIWLALRWWGYWTFARTVNRNEGTEGEEAMGASAAA